MRIEPYYHKISALGGITDLPDGVNPSDGVNFNQLTGVITTASNGLTKDVDNVIKLGGPLTDIYTVIGDELSTDNGIGTVYVDFDVFRFKNDFINMQGLSASTSINIGESENPGEYRAANTITVLSSGGAIELTLNTDIGALVSDDIFQKGLGDSADYSANKTDYSYATVKMLQEASGFSVSNGLTRVGSEVKLGGDLVDTITIIGDAGVISGTVDGVVTYYNKGENPAVLFGTSYQTNSSRMLSQSNEDGAIWYANAYQGEDFILLSLNTVEGGIVQDTLFEKGLGDFGDYSANKTDYSYVTKKWVTDNFSGGSGSYIQASPSSPQSAFIDISGGAYFGNQVVINNSNPDNNAQGIFINNPLSGGVGFAFANSIMPNKWQFFLKDAGDGTNYFVIGQDNIADYMSMSSGSGNTMFTGNVTASNFIGSSLLLNTSDSGSGAKLQVNGRISASTAPINSNEVIRLGDTSGWVKTASNGLTVSSNDVKLGGAVVGNTSITTGFSDQFYIGYNGYGLYIKGTDNTLNVSYASGATNYTLRSGVFNLKSTIRATQTSTPSLYRAVEVNGDAILISDTVDGKGAVYLDDYSANYVPRSLVDKGYVDGKLGSYVNTISNQTGIAGDKSFVGSVSISPTTGTTALYITAATNQGGILAFSDTGLALIGITVNGTAVQGDASNGYAGVFNNFSNTYPALIADNKGTGNYAEFSKSGVKKVIITNAGTIISKTGDIEVEDSSKGIILKDTVLGTRHRIQLISGVVTVSSAL